MSELRVEATAIDGLLILHLPVHGDARGWFKENWQREKMTALGLPDFGPVQNNMSFNAHAGATRGIHAEPWDKLVSCATGRIFGAWVDLCEGDGFGRTVTVEMGPETAVFVPYGVGNSYQALEDGTVYSYLVNDHWSPDARSKYTYLNLFDETVAIDWPIPAAQAEISDADRAHPRLADVTPMRPRATTPLASRGVLILGPDGQLGTELQRLLPEATTLRRDALNLEDPAAIDAYDFAGIDVVINAAAYTAVDAAEAPEGRRRAWAVNATAVARLAAAARRDGFLLVHVSSDYVFDGSAEEHVEDEPLSPLGVYGQTKAAGDIAAMGAPRHLIVRTSWVVGAGPNFVRTMAGLADRGVSPSVIADARGRLTFASTLADAILHLVEHGIEGVVNVSNGGPVTSWYDIACRVFELRGRSRADVTPVTQAEFTAGKEGVAPRPLGSAFDLTRLRSTGFSPADADDALAAYLSELT